MSREKVINNYLKSVLNTLVYEIERNYNKSSETKFIQDLIKSALNFVKNFEKESESK